MLGWNQLTPLCCSVPAAWRSSRRLSSSVHPSVSSSPSVRIRQHDPKDTNREVDDELLLLLLLRLSRCIHPSDMVWCGVIKGSSRRRTCKITPTTTMGETAVEQIKTKVCLYNPILKAKKSRRRYYQYHHSLPFCFSSTGKGRELKTTTRRRGKDTTLLHRLGSFQRLAALTQPTLAVPRCRAAPPPPRRPQPPPAGLPRVLL